MPRPHDGSASARTSSAQLEKGRCEVGGRCSLPGHSNLTPEDDELRRLKARGHTTPRRTGSTKKSRRVLRQPTDLTFGSSHVDNADEWPVSWMCQALEVSESGYYAWATRCPSKAQKRQDALVAAIEVIHTEVKQRYGSPRMTPELNARGYECSENMVAAPHASARHPGQSLPQAIRPHDRHRGTTCRWPRTSWIGTSIGSASNVGLEPRTSPTFRRWTWPGCTWRWSRICSAG